MNSFSDQRLFDASMRRWHDERDHSRKGACTMTTDDLEHLASLHAKAQGYLLDDGPPSFRGHKLITDFNTAMMEHAPALIAAARREAKLREALEQRCPHCGVSLGEHLSVAELCGLVNDRCASVDYAAGLEAACETNKARIAELTRCEAKLREALTTLRKEIEANAVSIQVAGSVYCTDRWHGLIREALEETP